VATQRIKNGERIQVDGDNGTVTLVDEVSAMEEGVAYAQLAAEKQSTAARRRKALLALAAGVAVVLALRWRKRRG